MKNNYEVIYLKHSLFKDCEKIQTTVTKAELIELLKNGMVTVLEARRI